jgi:hypothetical protein
MLIDTRSSRIQAIIDSIPSCIQSPVNAIAAPAVGAIIRGHRDRAAQS